MRCKILCIFLYTKLFTIFLSLVRETKKIGGSRVFVDRSVSINHLDGYFEDILIMDTIQDIYN